MSEPGLAQCHLQFWRSPKSQQSTQVVLSGMSDVEYHLTKHSGQRPRSAELGCGILLLCVLRKSLGPCPPRSRAASPLGCLRQFLSLRKIPKHKAAHTQSTVGDQRRARAACGMSLQEFVNSAMTAPLRGPAALRTE